MRIRIDWALLGEQFPVLLFDLMKVNSMTFVLRSCPQPVKKMHILFENSEDDNKSITLALRITV